MFKFGFFLFIAAVVTLNLELCFSACARAEYEINGECCPMCAPGNRVYWRCTIDTVTTCVPCPPLTYTDEPNGLYTCFRCTPCGAASGLRVKKTCTRSSNTVCEPLAGFYCIHQKKDGCSFALKHSRCQPGQYIKQAGTGSTDTVCADCTGDTYSDGSFSSCLPHTKCEDTGLTETNLGTHSSDTQCGNPTSPLAVILSVIATLILISTVVGVLTYKQFWKKERYTRTETPMDRH
ncbi:tumor necrosis factor receptor superfamily member 14-like [Danio rerio]|uniref:Tumor necrosis factor receptor superfamily member 14-like n=4 Tax=Danio rerio TaxID=7955 RepID=A0AC58G9N1_DANRE